MDRTEVQVLEDSALGQLQGITAAIELLTTHLIKSGAIDPEALKKDASGIFDGSYQNEPLQLNAQKAFRALLRGIAAAS